MDHDQLKKIDRTDKGILDYLTEMKRISELSVDLAYSALLLDDKGLAEDVINLEKTMNKLKYELEAKTVMIRLPPSEAEGMVAVLEVANSTEKISNAAREIASLVTKGVKRHPIIKKALPREETEPYKITVKKGSPIIGKRLGELDIGELTGMQLLALKKKSGWLHMPEPSTVIETNDILLLSGLTKNKKLLEKITK